MKLVLTTLLALAVSGCVIVTDNGYAGKAGGGTVLICHKGKKTLELPQEAVRAHINHGDTYGPC